MSEHLSATELRERLGDILSRVRMRHDRFVIERDGTALAALVPVATLEAMERLSREFLVGVLERRRGRVVPNADALANEAKQRTRGGRRR